MRGGGGGGAGRCFHTQKRKASSPEDLLERHHPPQKTPDKPLKKENIQKKKLPTNHSKRQTNTRKKNRLARGFTERHSIAVAEVKQRVSCVV